MFLLTKAKSKRCARNTENSNINVFEVHRLSFEGTKLLLEITVTKKIIIKNNSVP